MCKSLEFSVGICKYKPGYKSHDLSLVEKIFENNILQDLLSSWTGVFQPMRALKFITCDVIYNPAYTCKFQLKTTIFILNFRMAVFLK